MAKGVPPVEETNSDDVQSNGEISSPVYGYNNVLNAIGKQKPGSSFYGWTDTQNIATNPTEPQPPGGRPLGTDLATQFQEGIYIFDRKYYPERPPPLSKGKRFGVGPNQHRQNQLSPQQRREWNDQEEHDKFIDGVKERMRWSEENYQLWRYATKGTTLESKPYPGPSWKLDPWYMDQIMKQRPDLGIQKRTSRIG